MAAEGSNASTLRDYLHVLRRRKWLVLLAVVLVPASAVAFSLRQSELYEATAQVLISRQNLASQVNGTPDPYSSQPADRVLQTQANLARVPAVAVQVITSADLRETTDEFLKRSSVTPKQNSDLLDFKVTDSNPAVAARLATAYATQFTNYRRQLDTSAFESARADVTNRLKQLADAGQGDSALYASLVDKEQQLQTLQTLQGSNALVVNSFTDAVQVQPKPVRNAILGLALGLLLGLGMAFLFEALDLRVRSSDELESRLRLPLLGRLPTPPRKLRKRDQLVTLEEPHSGRSEAFRQLRVNVELMRLNKTPSSILVTSALEQEGKTTTAANLAVALARAGSSVAAVDLDLRQPYLHRFFGMTELQRPGLSHVVLGKATLDEALVPFVVTEDNGWRESSGENGSSSASAIAIVHVLTIGLRPPHPGEFAALPAVGKILDDLRARFDYVIVDSPPLLHVGDAAVLSNHVDAVLLVTRLKSLRRHHVKELSRIIGTSAAEVLGFVITDAEAEATYGYGYGYGEYGRAERERGEEEVKA